MITRMGAGRICAGARPQWSVRSLAMLLAIIVLTPAKAPAAEDRFAQVHRVGIIAALGDRIEIWTHGWTEKDSHLGYWPIKDWGLDDLTKQTAIDLIGDRFQIVPVVYDSSTFIVTDTDPPSEDLPPIKQLILALPPSDADAYLVIRKRTWNLSPLYVMGGLTAMRGAMLKSRDLFVTLQIDLVDAKTGNTLSARFVAPMTSINREDWADTPEEMSDTQAQHLRGRAAGVITRYLTVALHSMGLTGARAAP